MLLKVPPFFHFENSQKNSVEQPSFYPFNMAPQDDPRFSKVDFRNGCSNITECGIGLTPLGYYPCTLAGGIDRILDKNLGLQDLPTDDVELKRMLPVFCPLCGRFKPRIFIPRDMREKLTGEEMSESWIQLYKQWQDKREI
jgi:hypothetical protein